MGESLLHNYCAHVHNEETCKDRGKQLIKACSSSFWITIVVFTHMAVLYKDLATLKS